LVATFVALDFFVEMIMWFLDIWKFGFSW